MHQQVLGRTRVFVFVCCVSRTMHAACTAALFRRAWWPTVYVRATDLLPAATGMHGLHVRLSANLVQRSQREDVHNSFVSRRTQMYMIYRFFHLADICKNTAKVFAGVTRLRFYDTDIVFLSGDPFGVAGVDAARAAQYDVVATHHHGSYFVDFSCKGLLDYVTFIRSLYSGPRKVLQVCCWYCRCANHAVRG